MFKNKILLLLEILLISAVILAALSINTVQADNFKGPTCTSSGLENYVIGEVKVDGQKYFVRGMATIFDKSMDDYGTSAADDTLQIFCVSKNKDDKFGNIAMCLSGEECPWRK